MAAWIKMLLGMVLGLSPGDFVLDGDPAPLPKKGAEPQIFGPCLCGQTAGCIKMPLAMKVGLGLRDIVFDVDPATPTATQFLAHVYCGQMAGWMKTPLGTEVDLGVGHIVLDGVPAPAKGAQQPPLFLAHVCCGHGRPSQLLLSSCTHCIENYGRRCYLIPVSASTYHKLLNITTVQVI